jgi:hypothetical protein
MTGDVNALSPLYTTPGEDFYAVFIFIPFASLTIGLLPTIYLLVLEKKKLN